MSSKPQDKSESLNRIGLLAGAGRFPITFAQRAREQGLSVCCVGIAGMVPMELRDLCDDFFTVGLGQLGRAIRLFKQNGVSRAVMAGKIEKSVLFKPFGLLRLIPDWRAIRMWTHYAARDKKDDTILLAIIQEFGRDQIEFGSALEYCPNLLIERGPLTRKQPSQSQWDDIRFGWELAKEMGRLDVGQSVVVKGRAVLAVEAIEGTDRAIRRAGELCRQGGFTVVKVAKPQQDMRFDVPTIGVQTIRTLAESGGKVLAIESGRTIVLDRDEVMATANQLGVIVVAFNEEDIQLRSAA